MGKLVLLVILGFVVWWMWRKLRSADGERPASVAPRPPETMVGCALCGVNQPRSECVESGGRHYCCDAHRQQAESGREER